MNSEYCPAASVAFGNDMSRIVRGMAIILMVANHSLPGKVIGFAVPLFSFLVGYGYAFAKDRGLHNSLHRVWHLLSNYWIILLGICLPAALISYPRPIELSDVALGMFGLNPKLNFYSWYINFYIVAMALMPLLSRMVDRYGFKSAVAVCLLFGAAVWGIQEIPGHKKMMWCGVVLRWCRYMPIVVMGYWLASRRVFSRVRYRKSWFLALGAACGLVAIYFLRGIPYAQIFDLLWAPAAALLTAVIFESYPLSWLRTGLTEMGMKSMHIWFLHALFFTHATKGIFGVLTGWIHWKPGFVVAVLLLSYVLAILVDFLIAQGKRLLNRLPRLRISGI